MRINSKQKGWHSSWSNLAESSVGGMVHCRKKKQIFIIQLFANICSSWITSEVSFKTNITKSKPELEEKFKMYKLTADWDLT